MLLMPAGVALLLSLASALVSSTPAFGESSCSRHGSVASACEPGWEITTRHYPTNVAPGSPEHPSIFVIEDEVFDVGANTQESGQVTVTDTLPEGVSAIEAGRAGVIGGNPEAYVPANEQWSCTGQNGGSVLGSSVVTCTSIKEKEGTREPAGIFGGAGVFEEHAQIGIKVKVANSAREHLKNQVVVAGGGAAGTASASDPITISAEAPKWSLTGFDVWFSNADGTLDRQAGSHPYAMTVSYDLATALNKNSELEIVGGNETRNIEFLAPPGFVGNPTAVPQCTRPAFLAQECPADSQIGDFIGYTTGFSGVPATHVYNLVPPAGSPADFGVLFKAGEAINGYIESSVRSGGDYGITAHSNNIPERVIQRGVLVLWGVPGDQTHDRWHMPEGCTTGQIEGHEIREGKEVPVAPNVCTEVEDPFLKPFLTLPTACGAPLQFTLRATSWQHPELGTIEKTVTWHDSNQEEVGIKGCGNLAFGPTISSSPDTAKADTPTGLTFEVTPPVGGLEEPAGLGTSDIQNTTVTLPPGLVINPGQAAGLQACQTGDVEGGDDLPTPGENGEEERFSGPAKCPNASKVGTVKIKSPLIESASEKEFEGNVYVLQSNPPDLKLLVAATADGVNLKLIGDVHECESAGETIAGKTCEAPGQLITTFEHTPELPFTVFKLSFSGGAQAALDTPTQCGTYTTTSEFVPWSNMPGSSQNFIADAFPTGQFSLTEGPGGGPCPSSPLPFAPTLTAGSTTDQAGGYTHFSLLLERGDGQQRIDRLQFKAPEGLSGMISTVPLCPEPQASRGECSSVSQIGHATVASGPGPYPLVIPQPGEPESPIYLTGPYEGAPFGLSIVTHVLAGPFNLGTIVTRARIEVDPHTAQITVTTDQLPQVVAGVPTDLRLIDSVIDRPGFMFNPTNCNPSSFSGTAWGTPPPSIGGPGASAPISTHFGVGSCRELGFSPDFKASTSGKTSKAKGASLDVKVQYPSTPAGSGRATNQANIASVKVELPKQLPSRLTTLQKACTAAQFDTNPAGCPAASIVGHAVVHTPVLPVPLEGPAYFVSNGGEAFPNLIMVLQGYGVTVELVGDTFINKAGITSSTFKSTPDVPFSSFELNLPQGPYSALAANANLCAPTRTKTVRKRVTVRKRGRTRHLVRKVKELVPESLLMPTTIVGQNGAEIHQDTKIGVEGCPRHKTARKKAKRRSRRKHR
jgi:hypothetical protein